MAKQPLVPITPTTDLATVSTETLRAELARGLTLTADHLTRLGQVWAELERRGEDLADLREGLAGWLPLIAAGRLAPEAVVAFATRRGLLRALDGIPLNRQRRIAAGEAVQVIDPAAGPDAVAELAAARIPAAAVRLVFADGEVRSPQAQRLALRPRRQPRHQGEGERHYRPRFDREAGVVRLGRTSVRVADLLAELAASAGPELPALAQAHKEEYVVLRVRLLPGEQQRLAEAARAAELPDWELARKALRAFGLI